MGERAYAVSGRCWSSGSPCGRSGNGEDTTARRRAGPSTAGPRCVGAAQPCLCSRDRMRPLGRTCAARIAAPAGRRPLRRQEHCDLAPERAARDRQRLCRVARSTRGDARTRTGGDQRVAGSAVADRRRCVARGRPYRRVLRRARDPRRARATHRALHHAGDRRGDPRPHRVASRRQRHPRPVDQGTPSDAHPGHRSRSSIGGVPPEPPADALVPGRAGVGPRQGVREPLPHREGRGARVLGRGRGGARGARHAGGRRDRERSPDRGNPARPGRARPAGTARGARADREGVARRGDPVPLRGRHESPGGCRDGG